MSKQTPKETLDVYYEMLNHTKDESFILTVNKIIKEERWFPTIAVFLKYLPTGEIYQPPLDEVLS